MSVAVALALALVGQAAGVAAEPPRPSAAALQRAFDTNRPAVVAVLVGKRQGTGVVVGAQGQVLTSTRWVSGDAAELRAGDAVVPARVVMTNADLKVALLQADAGTPWPSAAVSLTSSLAKGAWLVGLKRSRKGEVTALLGQVTRQASEDSKFISTDLPLDPGSPLFDARGRLVAIAVQSRAGGCRAVALPDVKLQLAEDTER